MTGTYGDMQSRIADEIARSDLTSQIQNAIQSALRFYESERFWFNEGESTAPTVANQAAYATPLDFLEADEFTLTDSSGTRLPFTVLSFEDFRKRYVSNGLIGRPCHWTYYGDQFWLGPAPDAVYTLTLSYLKRLSTLSGSSDGNAWMVHGEELIRTRAKADLFANVIRSTDDAVAMSQLEQVALANLAVKSAKKLRTGKLRTELPGHSGFSIVTG